MRRVVNFEAQRHVLVHHAELVNLLDLQVIALADYTCQVDCLKEALLRLNAEAVLWVREKDAHSFLRCAQRVRLDKVDVGSVRLEN